MSRESVKAQFQNYLGTEAMQLHDIEMCEPDMNSDNFNSDEDLADTERTELVPHDKVKNIETDEIILIDTKEKVQTEEY